MRNVYKNIINIIRPNLKIQILGLILTICYAIVYFLAPMVSKYLIDDILPKKSMHDLKFGLMLFGLVCILQPLLGYLKNILFLNLSQKICYEIRNKLYKNIIYADIDFFEENSKGSILSRIMNDSDIVANFITNFFIVIIKNVLIVTIILAGMFYLSSKITSVIMIISVLVISLIIILSKKIRKISLDTRENYDEICSTIDQSLKGIKTIKVNLIEDVYIKKYTSNSKQILKSNIKLGKMSNTLNMIIEGLVVFCIVIIYGIGSYYVINNKMSLGTVVALGLYFQMLTPCIMELLNSNMSLQQVIPILERIEEYLNLKSKVNIFYERKKLVGNINVNNLCFSYKDELNDSYNLKNINLNIKENTLVAITGESGAGKSTLMKLLTGFYRPNVGTVEISNIDINKLSNRCLWENIALIHQDVELFNMSIKDNISIGMENISEEDIIDACKKVGIYKEIIGFDDGFETIISEELNISGGQRQRISMARAIIKNTPIIILDEPTASLDQDTEECIIDLLKTLSEEKTVLVITHSMKLAKEADEVISIKNGEIESNTAISI